VTALVRQYCFGGKYKVITKDRDSLVTKEMEIAEEDLELINRPSPE